MHSLPPLHKPRSRRRHKYDQPVPPQYNGQTAQQPYGQPQPGYPQYPVQPQGKSRIAAGILGILIGSLGIHNFYLGYTGKAVAQLLLSIVGWIVIVGPIIASIWGLVEGIMILTKSINTDAHGVPLAE
ncbi:MAG: NINE protein [Oscillospiraceae bacterium]|nr:NINE protein [Oscillospiraceae bacterium]